MVIKKLAYFAAWMLLTLPIAFAQTTVVSGTLVDPSGNVWANAVVTAQFAPTPNTPGPYTWSGGALNTQPPAVVADNSGAFTITLPSNTAIVPSGSAWQFTVAPNATQSAVIINVSLSGGTLNLVPIITAFNAWPVGNIPGTFINKVYNVTQVGVVPLNVGAMVYDTTIKQLKFWNGVIWQNVGTGSGGGVTPQGFGVSQFSTASGSALFAGNQLNANAFNTSNNGAKQAQILGCTIAVCNILFPDQSVDNSVIEPLPALAGGKVSSLLTSTANNTFGLFGTNPAPGFDAINSGIFQSMEPSVTVFTLPNPNPNIQGTDQGWRRHFSLYAAPGFSNGQSGCPLFCPLPGHSGGVTNWTTSLDDLKQVSFNSSGIREFRSNICGLFGIGDGQCGLGSNFVTTANGFIAPSDEGIYGLGSAHFDSLGDFQGSITSITDGNHFKVNATSKSGTQGQGRYIREFPTAIVGTDGQPLHLVPTDIIRAPGDTFPYGTVVSNNAHFPISTARGTLTNNCTVPAQMGTVAVGQNSLVNGCDVTVDTGFGVGHFDTSAAVCTFANTGNLHNLGSQVTSATTISGGHQVINMTMNRSVPAGAFIYQGGLCPGTVTLNGDDNFNTQDNVFLSGSVFPIVGSVDAHTAIYLRYDSSQVWQPIPEAGSQWGSRTPNTFNSHGFSAANITRVNNLVTMQITSGFQANPPPRQMLHNSKFFNISGCSDASINSGGVNAIGVMPGPDPSTFLFTQPGSNPDTSCPFAQVAMQSTTMDFFWGAEVLDVTNHTPGIEPTTSVDGTFVTSYNPHFVVGHAIDSPPHYEGSLVGLRMANEIGTPMTNLSGLNIFNANNSIVNGAAISIQNDVTHLQNIMRGVGGTGVAADAIDLAGLFRVIINADTAPIGSGAVLGVGFPSGAWNTANNSFRTYNVIGLDGTGLAQYKTTLAYNTDNQQWCLTFSFNNVCQYSWNSTFAETALPFRVANLQLEQFPGSPTHKIQQCANIPAPVTRDICYAGIIPTTAVITQTGTPGTTQYVYQLLVNDVVGPSFSGSYQTFTGAAVLNGTNFNNIPCTDLPAGKTGMIVVGVNPFWVEVGPCPNSATVVQDTGVRSVFRGNNPLIAGTYFYSGGFAATGLTGAFAFTQPDFWGTTSDPTTITASISQVSPGLMAFNGPTIGDFQGSLHLKNITIDGSCTGAGCTTGAPISLTTTGTSGPATLTGSTLNVPNYVAGSGTVTNVSVGSLAPLFSSAVANPGSTPAITYSLNSLASFISVADVVLALPTGAVAANTCTSPATVPMAGLTSSMTFTESFATNPSAVVGWGANGGLVFSPWPTANTLNWIICNQTSSSITPGALSLNIGAR